MVGLLSSALFGEGVREEAMKKSSWTAFLVGPAAIGDLYDGEPPLEGFLLRELRVEDRGASCFLRGDLARYPDRPRAGWPAEADRLELRLCLSLVEHFFLRGDVGESGVDLEVRRGEDGMSVEVLGRSESVEFEVSGMSLQIIGMRAYSSQEG